MASLEYVAASRATLVATHVVGTSYQIDVKLKQFSEAMDSPKTMHIALNGSAETVLRRATEVITATISWPDAINANMKEFLWSVAAGEIFQFDAYGTVASPDDPIDVIMINPSASMAPIQRIQTPTRTLTLNMRPAVAKL